MSNEKLIPEKTWHRGVTQSLADAVGSVWGVVKEEPVETDQEAHEAKKIKKPSKERMIKISTTMAIPISQTNI